MKCLLPLLLIIVFSHSISQAQSIVNGKVQDKTKANPLQDASIQLLNLKDSTVRSAKSNDKGAFSFERVNPGKYQISGTLLGFKKFEQQLDVNKATQSVMVELEPGEIIIEEITIAPAPNVAVRGDTLEFNSRNFATREYADADEMVAQVPGVTIDEDGKVSAHGEEVTKIMVDGKEFFSTDPKVALKTLPADIIDKLQIIDEKSEQSKFSGFDDGKRSKVINIVTKPDKKKGLFGKFNAGKGDEDKFSLNTGVNAFRGDEKVSINIMANNINETDFSEQGRGGFRRGNNNTDRGLSDTYAAAANYTNTFLDKKLEVNGNYRFRSSNTITNTLSDVEYTTGTRANQFQKQQQEGENGNSEHNLRGRLKWDIDSMNRLDINPNLSYTNRDIFNSSVSNMMKEGSEPLNNSDRKFNNNNSNFSFGGSLTYMHRFRKSGQTLSLNLDGNKSSNEALGRTLAFNQYYKDAMLDRIDTNNRESTTNGYGSGYNGRLSYTYNLSKISRFQANYGFRNTSNYSDRKTMEFLAETGQFDELNERLSNEFRNDFNHHSAGISYAYNKQDTFRFQIGINYERGIRTNDRTFPIDLKTTADFGAFLPEMTVVYFFTKERNLEFNYNKQTNTPSIEQLQDYIENSNELFLRNGNPNLNQEQSHRLRFQYRDVNRKNGRSFTSNINFDYINDKIIMNTMTTDSTITLFDDIILGAGGQYAVPENINGVFQLRANNNYGLPLKKLGFNLNLNNNLFYNRNYAILNKELMPNHSYGFSQHVGIYTNFSKKIIIGFNYNLNMNFTNNPMSEISHYQITNHRVSNTFILEFFKNMTLSYNYSYLYNGGVMGAEGISTNLLNASIGYKVFKKKNAEVSLKAFDLFNNAKNINRRVSEISISNITSNTLTRYFLLSVSYNLRNFGGRGSRED
ncbi:TonB dependent receptor [Sphingobacterium daejeonense]|uniref:TonB dependent receptor n=1 Tax=Sphingobacterium daejeonense TaxID=371142 RepID=UPI0021A55115|nr:TonB dependent receptor [Sphingobacterium daejeonense]MCT1532288.1 TonB dependent receptor [Sphingobacterium daejeonense]